MKVSFTKNTGRRSRGRVITLPKTFAFDTVANLIAVHIYVIDSAGNDHHYITTQAARTEAGFALLGSGKYFVDHEDLGHRASSGDFTKAAVALVSEVDGEAPEIFYSRKVS